MKALVVSPSHSTGPPPTKASTAFATPKSRLKISRPIRPTTARCRRQRDHQTEPRQQLEARQPRLVQQQRYDQAQRDLDRHDGDQKQKRPPQRTPERRVVEHRQVVIQADERRRIARLGQIIAPERIDQCEHRRKDPDQRQRRHRRRQKGESRALVVPHRREHGRLGRCIGLLPLDMGEAPPQDLNVLAHPCRAQEARATGLLRRSGSLQPDTRPADKSELSRIWYYFRSGLLPL